MHQVPVSVLPAAKVCPCCLAPVTALLRLGGIPLQDAFARCLSAHCLQQLPSFFLDLLLPLPELLPLPSPKSPFISPPFGGLITCGDCQQHPCAQQIDQRKTMGNTRFKERAWQRSGREKQGEIGTNQLQFTVWKFIKGGPKKTTEMWQSSSHQKAKQ